MQRSALTLTELLVAIAIIGMLIAILLPAVQVARESGRRTACASNLKQLALAVHQYEAAHAVIPKSMQRNYSFLVALLPYMEQQQLYDRFDFSINMMDYQGPLHQERVSTFECPSDSAARQLIGDAAATSYQGNAGSGAQLYGFNGLFGHVHDRGSLKYLPLSGITDGLSETAMLAECLTWDQSYHPLRVVYLAPGTAAPHQLDQFADICRKMPVTSPGKFTNMHTRGRTWFTGGFGWTLYNHILPPNSASCWNGANSLDAAYSSSSFHPGVVNVAFADGGVHVVETSIETGVWRKLASRNGQP